MGLAGLQLLGLVIDILRHALDPSSQAPRYPLGWMPPSDWPPLRIATVLSLGIMFQAIASAILAYAYATPSEAKR
jgi:hypothetical protein